MMNKYADMLSLGQLSRTDFSYLLSSAAAQRTNRFDFALAGKNIALIFEKPSLRTRVTFEVAIRQLGAWPILLGDVESQLGERESIPDLARNLSLWVDGIVARVFRHVNLEELATFATIPVINALSDWNNVSRSLWKACELSGISFRAICPKGYGPQPGETVEWFTEPDAVEGAD